MARKKLNIGFLVTVSGRWPRELPERRLKEYGAWVEEAFPGAGVQVFPRLVCTRADVEDCVRTFRTGEVDLVLSVYGAFTGDDVCCAIADSLRVPVILWAPREEAWKHCRDSMQQLAAYCDRKKITLFLEELKVTTSNTIITSADLARMLREIDSPWVVGMVDMDQMTYAGETVDDYFGNLGEKLQHVHFNDRGHTVPGDADFPMKEYYDAIVAHNYQGTCSFEICDRRYYCDPDKAIDDIVAWLRANTNELD